MVQYANSPDDADLPPLLRQMTAVVRCNSSAYLSYTKAEIASNSQDWSEARQRLAEAEVHWHDAYTTAMGLGLPQSPQLALSTLALSAQLTGACSRRMSHEQELRAQIANLDLEVDQLNAEIRKLAERPTDQHNSVGGNYIDGNVAGSVTSGDNVQGSKVDGNIAGDVTEGDKFTGIKATDNAVVDDTNFSQLWQANANKIDLPALSQQLGELYTQLESSGDKEHDPQISAVLAAQKAAEDGDGPKVLKWLRGAGGWVLDHAKDIAPIAATAIKIALGVAV